MMTRLSCAILCGLFFVLTISAVQSASAAPPAHLNIPGAWRKVPTGKLTPEKGYSWYRAMVKVPQSWNGSPLTLFLEAMDDARAAYINGTKVGATGTFPPEFRSGLGEKGKYRVSPDLINAGKYNVIAVRVYQNDPRPNFSVAPPVLLNSNAMQAVRLDGAWQYLPRDDNSFATGSPGDFDLSDDSSLTETERRKRAGYAKVDAVDDVDRYVTHRKGDNDPLSPSDAEKSFQTPDDLQLQLVLSEPDIAQPLFMTWDERGRLWVLEFRQYPDIAGVKMLSRDVYLRSVYDKVPEPPPYGAKGADRISVHEDVDGDGVYEKHQTFVDGLNLASSVAIGHGGAYVTNPPYLLFYADSDNDGIADGDPEVLLEGFGFEDSHSIVNSLRFGPDGWLYGGQGSTVTANIKRPGSDEEPIRTVGQQIWRYHPKTKRFEVFAEGGGNTFGCEIDSKGRIFSGHNGGNTRGFHYVQGGYYRKGFGKHGPLSNSYAFGYFENIKHHTVARFTHNFVIYEDNVLPKPYHGRLFGIEPLQGQIVMSDIRPYQSSFQTKDVSRVVKTDDQWFRPVDIKTGPDGGIYIADMYEQRIDHSSHYAGRIDKTNGRIYRLVPRQQTRKSKPTIAADPVEALQHPTRWIRQTANRLIGDLNDSELAPALLAQAMAADGQLALESLWALNLSGGLTDDAALDLLNHEDPHVRAWTVRLLGDTNRVSKKVFAALQLLAENEPTIQVRKQLASSAKRLPARNALPIIRGLLLHDEDSDDIHQPLLLWWAVESKADRQGRNLILQMLQSDDAIWSRPLMQKHLLERLMKRYALSGTREELLAAAELLNQSPDEVSTDLLLKGFEEAFKGRSLATIPAELVDAIAATGGGSVALRLRQGQPEAIAEALSVIEDEKAETDVRRQFVEVLGEVRQRKFVPTLMKLVKAEADPSLVAAALTSLQSFDDADVGNGVIQRFPQLNDESKLVAETLLAGRMPWAIAMLNAVDTGSIKPELVSEAGLRKMLLHDNETIAALIHKHWGSIAGASTEEMKTETTRLTALLNGGSGNPKKGKPLFMKQCGKCHRLFAEGGQIGPDLTSFKRDNLERILVNIVNPSLEIREGFESHVAITIDGRVVTGFLADKDSQVVVLRGVDGQNIILRRDEIDELMMTKKSLMPEGSLKNLSDQEVRDLFAYLRSTQPVNY